MGVRVFMGDKLRARLSRWEEARALFVVIANLANHANLANGSSREWLFSRMAVVAPASRQGRGQRGSPRIVRISADYSVDVPAPGTPTRSRERRSSCFFSFAGQPVNRRRSQCLGDTPILRCPFRRSPTRKNPLDQQIKRSHVRIRGDPERSVRIRVPPALAEKPGRMPLCRRAERFERFAKFARFAMPTTNPQTPNSTNYRPTNPKQHMGFADD